MVELKTFKLNQNKIHFTIIVLVCISEFTTLDVLILAEERDIREAAGGKQCQGKEYFLCFNNMSW